MPLSIMTAGGHDPSATLRGDPRHIAAARRPAHMQKKSMEGVQKQKRGGNSQTSDSSASSTAPVGGIRRGEGVAVGKDGGRIGGGSASGRGVPGPLSPKRRAELAGKGKEGSEGSMGSSFSDLDGEFPFSFPYFTWHESIVGGGVGSLDIGYQITYTFIDASVTQSALEEALASKMQAGGMASRMSTISQALRSKYL